MSRDIIYFALKCSSALKFKAFLKMNDTYCFITNICEYVLVKISRKFAFLYLKMFIQVFICPGGVFMLICKIYFSSFDCHLESLEKFIKLGNWSFTGSINCSELLNMNARLFLVQTSIAT